MTLITQIHHDQRKWQHWQTSDGHEILSKLYHSLNQVIWLKKQKQMKARKQKTNKLIASRGEGLSSEVELCWMHQHGRWQMTDGERNIQVITHFIVLSNDALSNLVPSRVNWRANKRRRRDNKIVKVEQISYKWDHIHGEQSIVLFLWFDLMK